MNINLNINKIRLRLILKNKNKKRKYFFLNKKKVNSVVHSKTCGVNPNYELNRI
jgi:hypothetical protein